MSALERINSEWKSYNFVVPLYRKVHKQVDFHVKLWLTSGLPHFFDNETDSEASFSQTVPPSGAKMMEKKTSELEWKRCQVIWGCSRDKTAMSKPFAVKMHVDCKHAVPPLLLPTHLHKHTCMHKQKHYATMTSSVRDVKVPEDWMWQTWFVMTCTNSHILCELDPDSDEIEV